MRPCSPTADRWRGRGGSTIIQVCDGLITSAFADIWRETTHRSREENSHRLSARWGSFIQLSCTLPTFGQSTRNDWEAWMTRAISAIAITVSVLLPCSAASGQYVAAIQACSRDVVRHCAPSRAGGDRLTDCIKTHFNEIAWPCQTALVRIAGVSEACGADIQEHCAAVRPSAGRILICVKTHFAALSERCKDVIGDAAERKAWR